MNNPQKVYDFLKANPKKFYCDDCVEKSYDRRPAPGKHNRLDTCAVSRRIQADVNCVFTALQQPR